MKTRSVLLTALLSSFFTLTILIGSLLIFTTTIAAPAPQVASIAPTYVSVSALVFEPLESNVSYNKNTARQLLTVSRQDPENNRFTAPLMLPDRSILTGMTVFGEDFDNQGAVTVRLKRCDHNQARCVSLAQPTSTAAFALGQFETVKLSNLYEVVDNNLYNYHLELELTALNNSGLRSVKLEILDTRGVSAIVGNVESWRLGGNLTNFVIPNQGPTDVQVCTDDLSYLPNSTHYPLLVVDGRSFRLSSNSCQTATGLVIEIRRSPNTGPSSGTYQLLR